MHINHVITSLGAGGAEYVVVGLARRQASLGHDVSVFTLFTPEDEQSRALVLSRTQKLRSEGIRVEQIGGGPRDGLVAGMRLRRLQGKIDSDGAILHAHNATTATVAVLAAGSRAIVTTLHAESAALQVPPTYWRLLSRRVDAFVVVAEPLREDFSRFINADIAVIENGVDLAATRAVARRWDRSPVRLLAAGRIHDHKNYGRLIRAVALIRRDVESRGVRFRLEIAGAGPGLADLRGLARKEGVSDLVTFLGFSDRVPSLMSESDVFVMSSDNEGMPIALLEALAASMTCVTTPFPAARAILQRGEVGLVASDFTDCALASVLKQVLLDGRLRRVLSERSYLRSNDYSMDQCADRYMAVYSRGLTKRVARL